MPMKRPKINISSLKGCYGCGVCAAACPKRIIDLRENRDGFYAPVVTDEAECVNCHACLDVCAFAHPELARNASPDEMRCYGAWSLNPEIRRTSTSGGLGFEIARYLVEQGYKAIVVRYNAEKNRAEHYVASSAAELAASQKTKYIPSYTADGFSQIKRGGKYVIVGLPCQIDSMRRHIRRLNIEKDCMTVDLLCYGTPSNILWDRYLQSIKPKVGGAIKEVNFRYKGNGWHHSSCSKVEGEKGAFVENLSPFYRIFFSGMCLNECCHSSCKYKLLASAADIRVGDFWGKTYAHNEDGVNAVISLSHEGQEVINRLRDEGICSFEEHDSKDLTDYQKAESAPQSVWRPFLLWCIRSGVSLKAIVTLSKMARMLNNPRIIWNKITGRK